MTAFALRSDGASAAADELSYSVRGCRCGAGMHPAVDDAGRTFWRCTDCGRTHRR